MPKKKEYIGIDAVNRELVYTNTISTDYLVNINPLLKVNVPLRMLDVYIRKGPHILDVDTGIARLPRSMLALFMGKEVSNAQTGKFLEEYKKQINKDFEYRDYYHQGEKDRQIITTGEKKMFENLYSNLEETLYVIDLKKFSRNKQIETYRKIKKIALEIPYIYKEQKIIADYLHHLPFNYFEKSLQENGDKAFVLAIKNSNLEDPWNDQQLGYLKNLNDMPFPFYLPSRRLGALTPRIFDRAATFLKKEVRHALFSDSFDLDLKNCQLVILNMLSPINSLNEFLEKGESVWPHLLNAMNIPESLHEVAKPHIKEAVYSLCYGMSPHSVEYNLRKNFANKKINKGISIPYSRKFTDIVLIKDIAEGVGKLKQEIVDKGYLISAFGRINYGVDVLTTDVNSFLACIVQTYELACILACYEVALEQIKKNNSDSMIMLHQHDGISVVLKNGGNKEIVVKRLQKAVRLRGEEYGMKMILEVD